MLDVPGFPCWRSACSFYASRDTLLCPNLPYRTRFNWIISAVRDGQITMSWMKRKESKVNVQSRGHILEPNSLTADWKRMYVVSVNCALLEQDEKKCPVLARNSRKHIWKTVPSVKTFDERFLWIVPCLYRDNTSSGRNCALPVQE